jgi:hypothetical protein
MTGQNIRPRSESANTGPMYSHPATRATGRHTAAPQLAEHLSPCCEARKSGNVSHGRHSECRGTRARQPPIAPRVCSSSALSSLARLRLHDKSDLIWHCTLFWGRANRSHLLDLAIQSSGCRSMSTLARRPIDVKSKVSYRFAGLHARPALSRPSTA